MPGIRGGGLRRPREHLLKSDEDLGVESVDVGELPSSMHRGLKEQRGQKACFQRRGLIGKWINR